MTDNSNYIYVYKSGENLIVKKDDYEFWKARGWYAKDDEPVEKPKKKGKK